MDGMDCLLPEVFAALRGEAPAHHAMRVPPAGIPRGHGPPLAGPPSSAKPTYGDDLAFHVDGANFTVQWTDPGVDPARAQAILDQLEGAWQHLVVEDGWPAPVSSDAWRLWVVLDPTVPGSGYTTLYTTDLYPGGYPISFLNPDYAKDQDSRYELSVAVHELGHMIQYAVRRWERDDDEAWYWEATAEWMAERGAPDIDTYAWSTYWYANAPDARYDAQRDGHAYGMLIVNAWLEEYAIGPLGVRDVWAGAGTAPWREVLADAAGSTFGELIRNVSAAYAGHTLRESTLFYDPVLLAEDLDEVGWWESVAPESYGTHYLTVAGLPDGETFWVDGSFLVAYVADDAWTEAPPEDGPFTVTITQIELGSTMTYGIGPLPPDDYSGDGADTGGGGEPQACGCTSGTRGSVTGILIGALLWGGRRRRAG